METVLVDAGTIEDAKIMDYVVVVYDVANDSARACKDATPAVINLIKIHEDIVPVAIDAMIHIVNRIMVHSDV